MTRKRGGKSSKTAKDKQVSSTLSNPNQKIRRVLMNVVDEEQLRVAITGKYGLEELYIEKVRDGFAHGNIYKGKVQNIEPTLQAAFVDIGCEKNGFLHISGIVPPFGGYDDVLKRRKRKVKEDSPTISDMLYKGQELLVQITREQLSNKGPSLTTYVSLPGRYMVLMPAVQKRGISKKIVSEQERLELKKVLEKIDPPKDMGYIIRTAGMGKRQDELQNDVNCLTNLWDAIKEKAKKSKSPTALYQESDLVIRAIRDFIYDDVKEIIIDGGDAYKRAKTFLEVFMPEFANKLHLYSDLEPLFIRYGVEAEISKTFERSVKLNSGGEIIIEQTEALVAIDVNTGKFRKGESTRDTILAINLEAANEIARQLKLRDLGGLVMIDFIDMSHSSDKKKVEDEFKNLLSRDRAKTTVLPISSLGVMEMTRQRLRQSVKKTLYNPCSACGGTGFTKAPTVLATDFIRQIRSFAGDHKGNITVKMHPDTAIYFSNLKRSSICSLEQDTGVRINIEVDKFLKLDEISFLCDNIKTD